MESLCTKSCKITISPPTINHRIWILTGSYSRIWALECHLKTKHNKRLIEVKRHKTDQDLMTQEESKIYKAIAF